MPVGVDEYLRRSIRHFKSGMSALTLRFARVRACQKQLKAIVEQAAKYGIELYEIGLPGLTLTRTDLPEPATTATGLALTLPAGGEGVGRDGTGRNLNQLAPDSKNLQSVQSGQEGMTFRRGADGHFEPVPSTVFSQEVQSYAGDRGELESALKALDGCVVVPLGEAKAEWPAEASVRVVGTCPNPNILRGALQDGRGVSVWSKGLGNVRVGTEVVCVKVRDGEYRRSAIRLL